MNKTYITPALITANHQSANLFAISDVNSGGAGIGGGGGAGSGEGQRTRRYHDWTADTWTPFE